MVPHAPGIYAVVNVVSGIAYIGQSGDLATRKQSHFRMLRDGCHHNRRLRADCIVFGDSSFEFVVLERCPLSFLSPRERWWVSFYGGPNGGQLYNLETGGFRGKTLSHETRERLSAARRGTKLSPETIKKRTESRRGWRPSAWHKERVALAARGKKRPPHVVAAVAAAHRGTTHTAETKAHLSRVHSGRPLPLETIEKIVAKTRGQTRTPETKARMRLAQSDPAVRARQRESFNATIAQRRAAKHASLLGGPGGLP